MIIGLLSVFSTRGFGESLAFNSEERIIFISLNNVPCHARPTVLDINSNDLANLKLDTGKSDIGKL